MGSTIYKVLKGSSGPFRELSTELSEPLTAAAATAADVIGRKPKENFRAKWIFRKLSGLRRRRRRNFRNPSSSKIRFSTKNLLKVFEGRRRRRQRTMVGQSWVRILVSIS